MAANSTAERSMSTKRVPRPIAVRAAAADVRTIAGSLFGKVPAKRAGKRGCAPCAALFVFKRWEICGGEGEIRTPGTREGSTVFETAAIDHSATSPYPEDSILSSSAQIHTAREKRESACLGLRVPYNNRKLFLPTE